MFILDTNVISELRRAKSQNAEPSVISWATSVSAASLYLSVISVFEIEVGILRAEKKDPHKGAILRTWFDDHVLPTFAERTLDIDSSVALACASLHVPNPLSDRDSLIGATAMVHGMTVVTRNTKDYRNMPIQIFNPWST